MVGPFFLFNPDWRRSGADAICIACNNTLLYGPAVQVFYKPKVITTPAGCSDVQLVVDYV